MFDFQKECVKVLEENRGGVLATRDGEGVKTRAFQYQFSDGNRVYFCTSNQKDVYKQMVKYPQVSFCTYPADFAIVLSITGKAVFVNDMEIKKRIFEISPAVKDIYNSLDNPEFETFYIEVSEVEIFSFSEGTKTYTL